MTMSLPAEAVVRISRGEFDRRACGTTSLGYHRRDRSCTSASGTATNRRTACQLNEMIVAARSRAEAAEVGFVPIVDYPIIWTLP
jgi:hypothetical protein